MKNKLQLLLLIFLLNINNIYSQCGCDVITCMTEQPNVTKFNIYYGDIITLNAPPLPLYHVGTESYAWFTINTKTTDDPNQDGQYHTSFINGQFATSYTINPLDYSHANPTTEYFMCRTLSKSSASSPTTCFFGRSYKVVFNAVPTPVLTVSQNLNICSGNSITLSATNTVGNLIWRENSITGNIIGTGNSISVSPTTTTTYFVYANNGSSGNSGSTATITNSQSISTTVTVTSTPVTPIVTQNGNILNSNSTLGNQWYNQNGIINGATSQNYTPTVSGNYYVIVNSANCSSPVSNTISYIFLSNQDFDNNTVSIYPNPTNGHITIDCGSLTNVSGWNIKIVNSLGQEVFNGVMNTQQYVVPLNTWSGKGVYFVKIYDATNNVVNTKKIILQ